MFLIVAIAMRYISDLYWTRSEHQDIAKKYLSLTRAQKWTYASYLNSCIYSVMLVIMSLRAFASCDKPGNMFSNAYCRDNPADLQITGNAILVGVLTSDIIIQMFCVRDFNSTSELQTYLHHFLAIIGSVGGIYVGGTIGTISNFLLITEMTTPLANIRWLLHLHDLTHLKVYLLCAVGMTVGFLVVRVILMIYLAFYYLVPAIAHRDHFSDTARLY